MLTIQLYGLAEHPKTQLLKVSLLDALVELPVAFSFVQISTIDAFLEQKLPEIPCLMVNGGLIPIEVTQSVEELSKVLRILDIPPNSSNGITPSETLPPHAGAHPYPLPTKTQGGLRAHRHSGQESVRPTPKPPSLPPREDPPNNSELPRRAG